MRHRDTVESNSLRRVLAELDLVLVEVQHALEAYAENPEHPERLQPAYKHLQRIRGTLELAELFGASVLADEMRRVTRALATDESAPDDTRRLESLIAASVRLTDYLQHIRAGSPDMPAVLLPVINDLRAYRGSRPVEIADVFRPDLALVPETPTRFVPLAAEVLKRIRQRLNKALVLWFRGQQPTPFKAASQLAARLARHSRGDSLVQMWTLVAAVFEGLADGGLNPASLDVRRMVGRALNILVVQISRGDAAADAEVSIGLLRSLLFELGHAGSSGPLISGVRAFWQLPALLPDEAMIEKARSVLEGPSMKLLETVTGTIKDELTRVKDAIEIYVHGQDKNRDLLQPLAELPGSMLATLSLLGIDSAHAVLSEQIPAIERILASEGAVQNEPLQKLAAVLLDVDSRLDEYVVAHAALVPSEGGAGPASSFGIRRLPEGEFNELLSKVTGECLINIAKVRDDLLLYIEDQQQFDHLEQTLVLVDEIYGAAAVLPLADMVPVTRELAAFIRRRYFEKQLAPDATEQQLVADVIASLEYYLEVLQQDQTDLVSVIRQGARAMRRLQYEYPPDPPPSPPGSGRGGDGGPAASASATAQAPEGLSADHEEQAMLEDMDALGSSLHHMGAWLDDGEPLPAEQVAAELEAEASEARAEEAQRGAEIIDLGSVRSEKAAIRQVDDSDLAVVADDVDEEILEVFIEEAVDELSRLSECVPRWQRNPGDHDALSTIRRSFHTLKGSGRLVGALLIGEYAWSIENLLNRVIDKSIPVSNATFDLLDESLALLPQLIEQLKGGPGPAESVGDLITRAQHMAATGEALPPQAVTVAMPGPAPEAVEPEAVEPEAVEPEAVEPEAVEPEAVEPEAADFEVSEVEAIPQADDYGLADTWVMSDEPVPELPPEAGPEEYEASPEAESADEQADGKGLADTWVMSEEPVPELPSEAGPEEYEASPEAETAEDLADDLGLGDTWVMSEEPAPELVAEAGPEEFEASPETESADEAAEAAFDADQEAPDEAVASGMPAEPGAGDTVSPEAGWATDVPPEEDTDTALAEDWEMQSSGQESGWPESELAESATDEDQEAESLLKTWILPEEELPLDKALVDEAADLHAQSDIGAADGAQTLWQQDEISVEGPEDAAGSDADSAAVRPSLAEDFGSFESGFEAEEDLGAGAAFPAADTGATDQAGDFGRFDDFGIDSDQDTEDSLLSSFHMDPDDWPDVMPRAADLEESADLDGDQSSRGGTPAALDLGATEIDPLLLEIFSNESRVHLGTLQHLLAETASITDRLDITDDLIRALHTLHGSAQTADVQPIAMLSGALEKLCKLKRELGQPLRGDETELLRQGTTAMEAALNWLAEPTREPPAVDVLCERAQRALAEAEESAQPVVPFEGQDAELLSIFIEEGEEILDTSDRLLEQWQQKPDDKHIVDELKRQLHTLKGGARMAGFTPLADLSHATESLLGNHTEILRDGHGQDLFVLLHEAVDALTMMLEQARNGQPLGSVEWLRKELEDPHFDEAQARRTQAEGAASEPARLEPATAAEEERERPEPAAESQAAAAPVLEAQDVVRVRADLIDSLVNYAGEVNIYHSRLGQTLGDYRFNISELEQTVYRLRDQLRKMDMETEAQILNRYESAAAEEGRQLEDFDPLEFDRYTRIQELSRALMESVSDLESIKGILSELTRDSETLLLQQSRVSTDLQDGLMRTRMVRFDRLAARFGRIVRQTASTLKRKADLKIIGGETEVDRSVQDHIIAPIEHMLRNAVSHGIETPEQRRLAGKPETGTIELKLARDGGDVLITLSDDGAGIDVEAVRAKALRQGLLDPERRVSDRDLMQLILENGLSTASTISQISGRGVGLGVVEKEIKQLGGSIEIESVPGQGTRFLVRLPLTLAINQALLVSASGETFAIPLASIEGVTQVTQEQLQDYYTDRHKLHQYAGAHYEVHHLGSLLGVGNPRFDDGLSYSPLVLIRSGDYRVALHTEALVGRREIVVKPVGAQVSTVKGISGATIMADGQVVLILDVGALLRTGGVTVVEAETAAPLISKAPVIMVVDDSITIRKVTARMLERNQMNVVTAKDGMDALSVLTERRPDMILLDIEMPRMDGYEVAAYVRNNEHLHDVPIIMITSRTGRKHRERAEELGVNRYLGKPYLESELLDNINQVLAEVRG